MNIGIVGYGPAGIIAAISLHRSGHKVTMFERDEYTLENVGKPEMLDKSKTYPIDIGAKGIRAIEYIGAYHIFEKYCNFFEGVMTPQGVFGEKEKVPGFCGSRLELMWAL
jgi:2-polyprenyl-6-methoxyphenol hydroxylase-like FAD-dependent oxidoreductase